MTRVRHHRVAISVTAAVLVVGVIAFVALRPYLFARGTTTELSVGEVVNRYQRSQTAATDSTPASSSSTTVAGPARGPALPAPGVYVYATTGRDSVDALTGDHHDYPATTTITVTPSACGALERWDVVAERWVEWTRCARGDGVVGVSKTNFDRFFGMAQTDAYRCDGAARPVDAPPGTTWTLVCKESNGETETYRGAVVGLDQLSIGATTVAALHVRIVLDDGDARDSQVMESWFRVGTDLLLKETAHNATVNPSPIGNVNYREDYTLQLTSLEPLR
jgi:hypothetical protein